MESDDLEKRSANSHSCRITSRYVDYEGVTIESNAVPRSIRHLVPDAKYWAIGDDEERIQLLKLTPVQELRTLVDGVDPLEDEIWNWCRSHDDDIPVPDEVLIFDRLLQAAAEAKVILE